MDDDVQQQEKDPPIIEKLSIVKKVLAFRHVMQKEKQLVSSFIDPMKVQKNKQLVDYLEFLLWYHGASDN